MARSPREQPVKQRSPGGWTHGKYGYKEKNKHDNRLVEQPQMDPNFWASKFFQAQKTSRSDWALILYGKILAFWGHLRQNNFSNFRTFCPYSAPFPHLKCLSALLLLADHAHARHATVANVPSTRKRLANWRTVLQRTFVVEYVLSRTLISIARIMHSRQFFFRYNIYYSVISWADVHSTWGLAFASRLRHILLETDETRGVETPISRNPWDSLAC